MAPPSRKPINFGLLFDWHAGKEHQTEIHLDRPFDIAPERGTVYDGIALAALVREAGDWLYAAGLRAGDTLALVKRNHFDTVLLAGAAARIGVLPVLMSPVVRPDHLRVMIERAAPRAVLTSPEVLERAAKDGVRLTGPGVRVLVAGEAAGAEPPDGTVPLESLRGGPAAPARPRRDDEPMIVTHTSGTTGVPKLVVHAASTSLGTFPFQLESKRLPMVTSSRRDVVAGCFSFVHNRLVSWTSAQFSLAPKRVVTLSDPGLDTVERMLAAHRPTSLEALPNMFQHWEELADRRPELFARVRRFNSTFDAVHPRTVRTFLNVSRSRFPVWATGLGQSEIAGISMNVFTRRQARRWEGAQRDTTNVGYPPLVRVKVVDPQSGRQLGRGEPGLLMVAGKARCLTYLGEDDRYRAKLVDGWWNSGDLGERGRFGRIRMLDREVDVLPGMSCIELESTLLDRLPKASEVTVLGVPGGPPVPVLCMRDNHLDPAEWARATAGLPPLGEPRLVPWDEVPRTATWKVRRLELREMVLGTGEVLGTGKWT